MKINTRKLLLLLYAWEKPALSYHHLEYLWPDLSPSGRRSLITHLVRQQLITRQGREKRVTFAITRYGKVVVEGLYPFLTFSNQKGENEAFTRKCLVLHTSPGFDRHFIRLRRKLREERLLELTPSTYLILEELTPLLKEELRKRYFPYIALFEVGEWELGDESTFSAESATVKGKGESLSGVSNLLNEVIERKNTFSDANHQSKMKIFSAYERIFQWFENSSAHVFSSKSPATSGVKLLYDLQKVLI